MLRISNFHCDLTYRTVVDRQRLTVSRTVGMYEQVQACKRGFSRKVKSLDSVGRHVLFVGRFYNQLTSLINLEITAMSHNSNNRDSKDEEKKGSTEEDLDFQLDDFDEEIIDLVDPLEGEGEDSEDSFAHDESVNEDKDLSLEDFDVEMELGEDEPSQGSMMEPPEDEGNSETDSWSKTESEPGGSFKDEDETSEAAAEEADEEIAEDELFSDEALAELFASHESEVAKLLEEAAGSPGETERFPSAEPASVSEEELPEDLFADLEAEAEGAKEEGDTSEVAPVSEGEPGEDLFADLEAEVEGVREEGDTSEVSPVSEEELPEDLFADLEMDAEDVREEEDTSEMPPAVEEEVSDEVVTDFEGELDSLIDETVAAASALAIEEESEGLVAHLEGETEEVGQMDISEEIAPDVAEELASLVSGQVEEVLTRLVEERLPEIVERLLTQEIEKIRSSLESEE